MSDEKIKNSEHKIEELNDFQVNKNMINNITQNKNYNDDNKKEIQVDDFRHMYRLVQELLKLAIKKENDVNNEIEMNK